MQVRDVMTRDVVTAGPGTPVRQAAGLMAEGGFAALPVVDDGGRLVGIVAEADVLRDRLPEDPRLHLRRDDEPPAGPPSAVVGGVMTTAVRSVEAAADIADVARLLVHERLRSVPVVDGERLVGIVSRRDLLRTLVRPDAEIGAELLRLVERYTGELDAWSVTVADGVATVRRTRGAPQPSAEVEERALTALARTVGGLAGVHIAPAGSPAG
ncbi:CBS domain-containing protein [Geodermatophilus pulveris]|uniref:CBS domain-containing protein n=1 Tax=Geodermatophilus pulveris TaxID=1564159 RepID=A0A239ICC9_9ACTN|nr:CBS domain-containing protein [Geodermatophilus pulveris]SNS90723.1 CBS domain-containing protein [Geodermatophilus pulveris]